MIDEKEFDDIPEIEATADVSINPKYYIHLLYIKIINILGSQSTAFREDMLRIRILVQTLESLSVSSKIIPINEYKLDLKTRLESSKENTPDRDTITKLESLSCFLFDMRVLTEPMMDKKNKE